MLSCILVMLIAVSWPEFGEYFEVEYSVPLPEDTRISGEGGWTDWSYCSVNPGGDETALINPKSREVVAYNMKAALSHVVAANFEPGDQQFFFSTRELEAFDLQRWLSTIAHNGRKSDEVNLPLAVNYTTAGELLISDMGSRRILHFNSEGDLMRGFLLTGQVAAPNEIKYHQAGIYVAAGLNLDSFSAINGGDYCTIFSAGGEEIRSFAYTPEIAQERNLWIGVSAVLDIDDSGLIYLSFSVEGDIYVYDINGTLQQRLNHRPEWFVDPPALDKPVFKLEREPVGFWKSWTRIVKLLYAGDGFIVLVAENNGLVPGIDKPFIIDILTTDGAVLRSGITSDYWPVGRSDDNGVFWISFSGDHLIKTKLKNRQ
ncbi:MAG: hypothetical protein ACOYVF_09665 [Candidatus Zixiibacteriota bacterium]